MSATEIAETRRRHQTSHGTHTARIDVSREPEDAARFAVMIGGAAVAFSVLYLVSDVIELAQGGFSTPQLALTYAAEAAIPLFVLGLFAIQRPRIGAFGLIAAVTYAYTFVFFTSTVVYALVNHTHDWRELTTQLGAWLTIHSVLMVLAGVAFGAAVIRAQVLPRWTGITLIAGMVLMAVTVSLPDVTQTMSAAVRDLAFAGMGAAVLRRAQPEHRSAVSLRVGASG
jgi:Ca2+/Na+ antiporter